MSHQLELGPAPTSPAEARLFVTHWARLWGYRPLIGAAALLTSELATNAVVHAASEFVVDVENTGAGVRISVRDRSPSPPVVRPPELVHDHGRGMRLVEALATRWGSDLDGSGKTVWVELEVEDTSSRLT